MAARALAEDEQVHVVVDPGRRVEPLLEATAHVEAVPPGHDRRGDRAAALEVDRARNAHRDAPDRHLGVARDDLIEHLERLLDRLGRSAGDVPLLVAVIDDVAVERRDADADVQRAERADDDATLLGAEPERARRAAARRRSVLAVGEEAHLDGLVHALGHDASAESGDAPDLGPGGRLAGPHEVDDAQEARHLVGLCPESQC